MKMASDSKKYIENFFPKIFQNSAKKNELQSGDLYIDQWPYVFWPFLKKMSQTPFVRCFG